jgi:serine/threonine-protein kinase
VIHRDLKPTNILVSPRDGGVSHVKIADFGVASLAGRRALCDTVRLGGDDDATTAHATRRGVGVGTPAYLAPELADSGSADFAVDIFSFGVLAYELFAQRRPFAEPAFTRRLLGAALEPARSLAAVAPDVPARFAALVDACLDTLPRRRPSAATLAAALAEHATPILPALAGTSDVVTLPN